MSQISNFPSRNEQISLVHENITPADIRQGEKVSAKIIWSENGKIRSEPTRVWRLSPIGIEIIEVDAIKNLQVGETIELEVQVGKHISKMSAQKVTHEYSENSFLLVGFRFFNSENKSWQGDERRVGRRWGCSQEFMPTGVSPNPGRFNDFIFFRVADLSSAGLRLVASLRNKFLIPNMVLEATVSFPMVGQTQVHIRIKNTQIVKENGRDLLSIGAEFTDSNAISKDIIGQYIFQFGPTTSVKELEQENLRVKDATSVIDFKFVRTEEEYNQVLDLRMKTYSQAGKLQEDASHKDVADVYDTRSRIVIGSYRGKIIASARLIYNEIDDSMEHEQFVLLPSSFPRKDEICEITRVCVHPEFRGSQILLELFRYIGLTVVQSKRRYILGCGTDDILPLYRNIGFTVTSTTYSHSSLNNKKHTVFIGDVVQILTGANISPIYWNIVWGDLYQYLEDFSYIDRNPMTTLRVAFFKLFSPISQLLLWLRRRKRHLKLSNKKALSPPQ